MGIKDKRKRKFWKKNKKTILMGKYNCVIVSTMLNLIVKLKTKFEVHSIKALTGSHIKIKLKTFKLL